MSAGPVLDTNILSALLSPKSRADARAKLAEHIGRDRPTTSVISVYELQRGMRKLEAHHRELLTNDEGLIADVARMGDGHRVPSWTPG